MSKHDGLIAKLAKVESSPAPFGEATTCWYRNPDGEEAIAAIREMESALEPFAACCDQIADSEDDEEWAKFRLLIKDYRRARLALGREDQSNA